MDELNTIIEERIDIHNQDSNISELEKRIEYLEKSIIPEIDKSVREAIQDILDKYKKSVKDDLKNKEGKR